MLECHDVNYVIICVILQTMPQDPDHVKEDWSRDREDYISQLQAQIQQLEQENTDFLAALEDAMEQYKQQVREWKFSAGLVVFLNEDLIVQ